MTEERLPIVGANGEDFPRSTVDEPYSRQIWLRLKSMTEQGQSLETISEWVFNQVVAAERRGRQAPVTVNVVINKEDT